MHLKKVLSKTSDFGLPSSDQDYFYDFEHRTNFPPHLQHPLGPRVAFPFSAQQANAGRYDRCGA